MVLRHFDILKKFKICVLAEGVADQEVKASRNDFTSLLF